MIISHTVSNGKVNGIKHLGDMFLENQETLPVEPFHSQLYSIMYQANAAFTATSKLLHIEPIAFKKSWLAMYIPSEVCGALFKGSICNLKGWHLGNVLQTFKW